MKAADPIWRVREQADRFRILDISPMATDPTDRIEFAEERRAPIGFNAGPPARSAYFTPESYSSYSWVPPLHPIAAIIHGDLPLPKRPWPQLRSQLSPIAGPNRVEVIYTATPVRFDRDELDFEIAFTDDLIFAGCQLEDDDSETLSVRTKRLYNKILSIIKGRGYPHLLRTWNIIRDINREENGLERYRQFCIGRYEAFSSHAANFSAAYPAATCVGSRTGGLSVYILAAKAPGLTVENPKQVSAFHYPPQYGPRSPSFSRSLVKKWGGGADLFLSGTASITGHESRHTGELSQQIEETLRNIESLVQVAEDSSGLRFPALGDGASFKAYIRNTDDYSEVRARLEAYFGADIEILYLQADICRKELLFEIDGTLSTMTSVNGPAGTGG